MFSVTYTPLRKTDWTPFRRKAAKLLFELARFEVSPQIQYRTDFVHDSIVEYRIRVFFLVFSVINVGEVKIKRNYGKIMVKVKRSVLYQN